MMITGEMMLDLPGQRALLNEWVAHARDGRPAYRHALQPAQFLCQLAHISVLEACDGNLRFRLTGSEIRRQLGVEARGRYLSDFSNQVGDAYWAGSVRQALETQAPIAGVQDLGQVRHFWLRLPVCDASGRVNMVMCHDRTLDDETFLEEVSGERRPVAA